MVKKYIPLLLTFALATAAVTACDPPGTWETPVPTESPIVTETAPPTPTAEPTATPYVPPTPVTPGWQNAGWYPIAPPESFFDAANSAGDNYAHDGYDEWASREMYTFYVQPDGNAAIVCSVSAKNISDLTAPGQTYPQPDGHSRFRQLCSNIPLTSVGELPDGTVYSFPGGPQEGIGYLMVPDSELSSGNVYVSEITQDTENNRVGEFTGEIVVDSVLVQPYTGQGPLEICSSFPGIWGTPTPPTTQGSAPNNYDTLALASISSKDKYTLNTSQ